MRVADAIIRSVQNQSALPKDVVKRFEERLDDDWIDFDVLDSISLTLAHLCAYQAPHEGAELVCRGGVPNKAGTSKVSATTAVWPILQFQKPTNHASRPEPTIQLLMDAHGDLVGRVLRDSSQQSGMVKVIDTHTLDYERTLMILEALALERNRLAGLHRPSLV